MKPFNDRSSCVAALSKLPIEVSQRFALAVAREVALDLQTVVILNVVEDYLDGKVDRDALAKARDAAYYAANAAYANAASYAAASSDAVYYASAAATHAAYSSASWERLSEVLEEVKVEYERKKKVVA